MQGKQPVNDSKTQDVMAAHAYIARLAERGIDYVFANAGTDFAPIVEALSHATGARVPRFITVPHENVAMAMAHGYYRIAGKPAAVMVHVTVGTANSINGVINAARDNVPVLLAAGRTPLTETGSIASRNRPIHWGQEAFDQGGMLREYVKWDYELRGGQPVEAVVDRALDIAMSEPRGPVYLTLPREVLAGAAVKPRRNTVRPLGTIAPQPARAAIEQAAALIAEAEFPLVVTSSIGRVPEAVSALAALADEFALPVVQAEARDMNLPSDHPMHLGHDPGFLLPKADVVIAIDSVVPWMPRNHQPRKDAKVIHISVDPLETRYPFRELEADLLIAGSSLAAVTMLRETLAEAMRGKKQTIESRRKILAGLREEIDTQAPQADRNREGSDADSSGLACRLHQSGEVGGCRRHQRAWRAAAEPAADQIYDLYGRAAFRWSRLWSRRGARRQARGARTRGDRDGWRRLLHVRQPAPLSLCRTRGEAADADRRRQ